MDWTQRRDDFRKLMTGDQCLYPASVHDPISMRIAEDLGFEMCMFAGSIAAMTVLGAPDIIVLNQAEFADQAHRINRGGSLPLAVDADHGYGNAMNVMRTIEELETAGVSGITIEDTLLPTAFGAEGKTQILSLEEGAGKVQAAVAARQDPRLVILGRTSALKITDTDDTIARARAYETAGADMMMLVGLESLEQLKAISAAINIPIMLGGVSKELMDKPLLASHNVRICLQGHKPFSAAVQAIYDTLKALREGTDPADLKNIASKDLMREVTRADQYDAWQKQYL